MEKIKLDSEEREFLEKIKEKQNDISRIRLEVNSEMADFWKNFQEKHGFANYTMDTENGTIVSLSQEEVKAKSKE